VPLCRLIRRHGGVKGYWGFACPTASQPSSMPCAPGRDPSSVFYMPPRPLACAAGGAASAYSELAHLGMLPLPPAQASDWLNTLRVRLSKLHPPLHPTGDHQHQRPPQSAPSTHGSVFERLFRERAERDLRVALSGPQIRCSTAPVQQAATCTVSSDLHLSARICSNMLEHASHAVIISMNKAWCCNK
jgi:hypothetical protein